VHICTYDFFLEIGVQHKYSDDQTEKHIEHIGVGSEKIHWFQTKPTHLCHEYVECTNHGIHKDIHLCGDLLLGLTLEVFDDDLKRSASSETKVDPDGIRSEGSRSPSM
jgi:hypothetical protein